MFHALNSIFVCQLARTADLKSDVSGNSRQWPGAGPNVTPAMTRGCLAANHSGGRKGATEGCVCQRLGDQRNPR